MTMLRLLLAWMIAIACLPAQADHPTDLDHLLRQVREAHSREASVRQEREQRFLAEQANREQLLTEMRATVSRERARGENLKQRFEDNEAELQLLESDLDLPEGPVPGGVGGDVPEQVVDLRRLCEPVDAPAQVVAVLDG